MQSKETSASPIAQQERERYERSLNRLDAYAGRMDSQFRVPGTNIRFGLDPILGLLPGLGDLIALVLSLYLVVEAVRLGAGGGVVLRMLANLLAEFVIGLVPVLGDIFDVVWKANDRNARLLRRHITEKLDPDKRQRRWFSYLLIAGFGALMIWLLAALAHELLLMRLMEALTQGWVPAATV
ncbi:DUF4112 domain-containing protein [Marinobacter zhejiangensis]|uniref:DUF4112 domain-containing protein n=1 Tax=Marinobacter zhejiangensis TaxID=488535 RepID=A0A1I4QD42_9GAMM|nr:DUF4112 domain-containing protein [Marinobacter zhejiangensis]SFM37978.1 protein of unknown function [Marinobacter zhejiangensis]